MLTEEELAGFESAANSNAVDYVSKVSAAERLGLSVRRVLELSARGLLQRHTVLDPATKRRQTVFLAADLDRLVESRRDSAPPEPDSTPQSLTDYVSKTAAAERLGLSVRRVIELAASGLIKRGYVRDPVTKRWQTAFLAADVARVIENRRGIAPQAPDPPWLTLEEAAVYSGLPGDYLELQIRAGRLGALDVSVGPAGGYRVARRDLDAITATRQSRLHGMSSSMNHEPPPGVARYESGDAVSVGDLVQLRPGADPHWQTSLLLVTKVREDGRISGVVLRPHRSGYREAWYTYSLPEVLRIGRAPFPPPEQEVNNASYLATCPQCLGMDGVSPLPKPKPMQRETRGRKRPARSDVAGRR